MAYTQPSYVGTSQGNVSANPTTLSISLPSGWAAGDLALLLIYTRLNTKTMTTAPSGWTSLRTATGVNIGNAWLYYRYLQSGDTTWSATIASGTNGTGGWVMSVYRGVDPNTAPASSAAGSGTTQDPDPASESFTWAGYSMAVACYGQPDDNNGTYTVPSGYTDAGNWSSTLGNDGASGMAYKLLAANASSENPGTFNTASAVNYWVAWTVILRGMQTVTKSMGDAGQTVAYGNGSSTTVGSHQLHNRLNLLKITVGSTGSYHVLESLSTYLYQAGGNIRAVVYSDNAGSPGSFISAGPSTAVPNSSANGWLAVYVGAILQPSTSYWIGFYGDSNCVNSYLYNIGTTGNNSHYKTTNDADFANPLASYGSGTSGSSMMDWYTTGYWDRPYYTIRNLASDTLAPTYDTRQLATKTVAPTYDILAQLAAVLKTLTPTYDMRQLGTKTLTPAYNLLNKVAQTLAPSYNLRQLATKVLTPTYSLRQLATKTLAPAYNLRQLATKTLAPAYNLLNKFSQTLTPTYSMRQLATKTVAPVYSIINFATKTLTATYDLRNKAAQTLTPVYDIYSTLTSVLKTLVATYDMRQLGTKTLAATYNILTGPFTKTLTPTYDVRQVFGKTLAPSYSMRQLATKTVVPTYNIINLSGKTLSPTYNIVNYAGKTLAPSYNVRQLGTKTVAPTYNLRQLAAKALTPSYNMRSLVNKPLTATYSMRESVRKELSPNYFLRQLSGKTLTPLYSVFNSQSKTLSVTYNLREAVGANLIPSYYITENANLSVTFTFAIERPQGERGYRIIGVSIGGVEITRDIMDTGGVKPTEFVSPRIQNGGPKTCR